MYKNRIAMAYFALLLAMMISAGNFLFGNLAVDEIPPEVLTFWRCLIAALCCLPFVLGNRGNPFQYLRRNPFRVAALSIAGLVASPWLVYMALQSDELIDLGAGYTSIPLLTILFSAFLLSERLRFIQYLGVAIAFAGALVFVFRGSVSYLVDFKPHVAFLLMIASNAFRALYMVLLKKWDLHPKPDEGLFVIFLVAALVLLPGFIAYEASTPRLFDYSWKIWGSIVYVGVGMGALYLHLLNFGTSEAGASRASLFAYLVPIFVAIEAVVVLGSSLHIYQIVGGALIVGGVLIATRSHPQAVPAGHALH